MVFALIESMKQIIAIIGLFVLPLSATAQQGASMVNEERLVSLLDELRSAENNADKEAANTQFKAELKTALEKPDAFDYPFDRLSTVGFINSNDNKVRIINWNVEQDDRTQKYYGFVMHYDKRKKTYHVTELKEDLYGIKQPEGVVTADAWYGALYYKIIPVKKGSKTVYTVLGWDGNTTMSNIKLMDVMYVSGKNVKFGMPLFKTNEGVKRRVFYEHSEKAVMYLNYEDGRDRIIMDHLSPESPSMKGFKSFYVPDLSYDAYKFQGNKWVLHEDVIGVNDEHASKQVVYIQNPKTGKLEKKTIKSTWVNPEDKNAPVGGIEHVAVTPESALDEKEKEKENVQLPEYNKKDKRDPNNLSIYDGMKKKKKRRRKKRN